MLSLLSKIWLRYKKTMITSLKLHQISTSQSITYQNYIWTKAYIFSKRGKLAKKYQQQLQRKLQTAPTEVVLQKQLQRKLQTAPTEVETTSAKAETIPAHSAIAPAVVPEKSHKTYLSIFSQIMNLMSNTFLQANDVIWMTSSRCNSCD